jgi:hypothetical protein
MNDIKTTNTTKNQVAKYTPEAEAMADAILKPSGSNLKNYTMAKTREAIISAAQKGIDDARAELLEATTKLLQALRCALADLEGVKQCYEQGTIVDHDWKAHQLSIDEARAVIANAKVTA